MCVRERRKKCSPHLFFSLKSYFLFLFVRFVDDRWCIFFASLCVCLSVSGLLYLFCQSKRRLKCIYNNTLSVHLYWKEREAERDGDVSHAILLLYLFYYLYSRFFSLSQVTGTGWVDSFSYPHHMKAFFPSTIRILLSLLGTVWVCLCVSVSQVKSCIHLQYPCYRSQ